MMEAMYRIMALAMGITGIVSTLNSEPIASSIYFVGMGIFLLVAEITAKTERMGGK